MYSVCYMYCIIYFALIAYNCITSHKTFINCNRCLYVNLFSYFYKTIVYHYSFCRI